MAGSDQGSPSPLEQFWNQKDFSDVAIKCGDRVFHCHKLIITKKSSVLAKMLDPNGPFKEANAKEVALLEDDPNAVEVMLKHLYDIEFTLSANSKTWADTMPCLEILKIADKYDVPTLTEAILPACHTQYFDYSFEPDLDGISEYIGFVYNNLNASHPLHKRAGELAADHWAELVKVETFRDTAARNPELALCLLEHLAGLDSTSIHECLHCRTLGLPNGKNKCPNSECGGSNFDDGITYTCWHEDMEQ